MKLGHLKNCAVDSNKLESMAISQLRQNPYCGRGIGPPRDLTALTESIALVGVLQPVLVARCAVFGIRDDKYVVLDGYRRVLAAAQLRETELPVIKLAINCRQSAVVVAHQANQHREHSNAPIVEALFFTALLEDKVFPSLEAMATMLGRREQEVRSALEFLRLPTFLLRPAVENPERVDVALARALVAYHRTFGEGPLRAVAQRVFRRGSRITAAQVIECIALNRPCIPQRLYFPAGS